MKRINVSSGLDPDASGGESRAVRIGNIVRTGGVGPLDQAGKLSGETAGEQTIACLNAIAGALEAANSGPGEIVHVRVEVTSADDLAETSDVLRQYFSEVQPAMSYAIVAGLRDPAWKLQIEVEAISVKDASS